MSTLCSGLTFQKSLALYRQVQGDKDTAAMKQLCLEDLYYLVYIGCRRKDFVRPEIKPEWLYERAREVEADPDGFMDLWAREHYKSTLITFGMSIKDILNDPETTIGIFSHTRPIAKKFLSHIKVEFEDNEFLKALFPEILHANPKKDSKKWSLDDGIVVKRMGNSKEATVEAWGLVDGQPTGMHFGVLNYDDVVSKESVTNPEQIKKTTESWELSLNLGRIGGVRRTIGTRYHANDTYKTMMDRKSAIPRLYPATDTGEMSGKPVFLQPRYLDEKRRDMGPYIFGCQMLQNPVADRAMGFQEDWLRYGNFKAHKSWNYYILVDPANEKKKSNDYTVMTVLGLGPDNNYYVVDWVRDRLNLTQRAKKLFDLHKKWKPKGVGYEKYGIQADIQHIEFIQGLMNYRFTITPLGGNTPKNDRIRTLVPIFEQSRMWLPTRFLYQDHEGKGHDLSGIFVNQEYLDFPVSQHDDMLDCMARVLDPDLDAQFPDTAGTAPGLEAAQTTSSEYDIFR